MPDNVIKKESLENCRQYYRKVRRDKLPVWQNPEEIWERIDLSGLGETTLDQHHSGYCWLIGFLNCMEMKNQKAGVSWERPSLGSLIFYDKLEKANWFLNRFFERIEEKINDREIQYLLNSTCNDQGHWDMAVHLVSKYGLRADSIDAGGWAAQNTKALNDYLKLYLQSSVCYLKDILFKGKGNDNIQQEKKNILQGIYCILGIALGEPAGKKYKKNEKYSDVMKYISISCIPAHPYNAFLEVSLDGNVEECGGNTFYNIPPQEFFKILSCQMEQEGFCYIGCDGRRFMNHINGIWDEECFVFPEWTGKERYVRMNRQQLYDYGITNMSHSVVLSRMEYIDGNKWWIARNSLGKSYGKMGYAAISDQWLQRYTVHAVVRSEFVDVDAENYVRINIKPWELYRRA